MPHLTLAANEKAFKKLLDAIVHNAVFEDSGSADQHRCGSIGDFACVDGHETAWFN